MNYVAKDHPDASQALETLITCTDFLASGTGGIIIAVVEHQLLNAIQFHHLDDGHLSRCFNNVAPNLHKNRAAFLQLLNAFCAHGNSDRWSLSELERLMHELPQVAKTVAKLEGNPKDG